MDRKKDRLIKTMIEKERDDRQKNVFKEKRNKQIQLKRKPSR